MTTIRRRLATANESCRDGGHSQKGKKNWHRQSINGFPSPLRCCKEDTVSSIGLIYKSRRGNGDGVASPAWLLLDVALTIVLPETWTPGAAAFICVYSLHVVATYERRGRHLSDSTKSSVDWRCSLSYLSHPTIHPSEKRRPNV